MTLSPELETRLASQTYAGGFTSLQRPNATRMLAACLYERGYEIQPAIPLNGGR